MPRHAMSTDGNARKSRKPRGWIPKGAKFGRGCATQMTKRADGSLFTRVSPAWTLARLHGGGLGPRRGCVVPAVRIMGWGNCTPTALFYGGANSADFLAASDGCGGSVPVTPNPHPRGLAGKLSACRLGPRFLLTRLPTPACVADHGQGLVGELAFGSDARRGSQAMPEVA
jgi:hypothetical protein